MSEENPSPEVTSEPNEGELFDILIPPGVPVKLILEITQKFDVQVVKRKERLYFANMEGDERELLAFRGSREELEKVQTYLMDELKKFVGE
jgi:hypothetical protein